MTAELAGQRLRHRQQCRLRHLVRALLGVGMADHHRVHVDDRPVGLGQRGRETLDQPKGAEHGELDRVADVLERGVGQRLHRRHPKGVVDEHVDFAVRGQRCLDQIVDLSLIGDIGGHGDRTPAHVGDLLGHVVEAFGGAGGKDQVGTRLRASPGQRGAQSRTDTADDDDLVLQQSGHLYPSILLAICRCRNAIRARQSCSEILLLS